MFNIFKLQDIQIEDITLRNSYYNAMLEGRLGDARNIYNNNSQLHGKALTADMLNQFLNYIYILEDNYRNEVDEYLGGLIGELQILIDELVYMQLFNEGIQYTVNNFVLYNDGIYYCKLEPPIGTLPTNDTYWLHLGLKGESGSSGLGISYRGPWSPTNNYSKYDAVIYHNNMYVAEQANTNVDPESSAEDWFLAVHVIPLKIIISETEPENLSPGSIWFKIFNTEGD